MKQSTRVLIGLGLTILAGALFVMKDSPRIDALSAFGGLLGQESCLCLQSGQEGGEILAELMGGGQYLGNLEEEGEQEEVMAVLENSQTRKNKEIEPDASQPMLGDVETGQSQAVVSNNQSQVLRQKNALVEQLRESKDVDFLWKNFYIVDSTTSVTKKQFDVNKLLSQNMKLKKKEGKKQILIYHTHGASETFQNSRKNVAEDTVVGVGTELAKELEKRGYSVYHDTKQYDRINGKIDRSLAYNESLAGIQKIRSENPDIKVMIDLHRDSVGKGKHTYTTIQGKKCAIVMFFNGMSRNRSRDISYLYNPNLLGNLAFSLQLKCKAMEYYDGFTKPIYLKGYRYNLHLEPRSLLIELGNENNTIEEAKNASAPLADVLDKVLSGVG
ncbi:MAG: stage II sporulation protein P [Eubacterium sp.]|nr:stage II sporulation protein P [Eubacterium sp.]